MKIKQNTFIIPLLVLLGIGFLSALAFVPQRISSENSLTGLATVTDTNNQTAFDAGITPDSSLYFLDTLWEKIFTGKDPQKILENQNEKFAESLAMAQMGKEDLAKDALAKAEEYSLSLEKEVNPTVQEEIMNAEPLIEKTLTEISEKIPNLSDKTMSAQEQAKRISLAADIAKKINSLCTELSTLDPKQYAQSCISDESSPKWLKEQDKKLISMQKKDAEELTGKVEKCRDNPEACDCSGLGVQSFTQICEKQKKKMEECKTGKKEACDFLKNFDSSKEFGNDFFSENKSEIAKKYAVLPEKCTQANIKTEEACRTFMFETGAPKECVDAGIKGDSETDYALCKKIMMDKRESEMNADKMGKGFSENEGFTANKEFTTNPNENNKMMNAKGRANSFNMEEYNNCRSKEDEGKRTECFESIAEKMQNQDNGKNKEYSGDKENSEKMQSGSVQGKEEYTQNNIPKPSEGETIPSSINNPLEETNPKEINSGEMNQQPFTNENEEGQISEENTQTQEDDSFGDFSDSGMGYDLPEGE